MQIKSRNHETSGDVTKSYAEAMIKSEEDFVHFVLTILTKLKHLTTNIFVTIYERVNERVF